jgi:5'/3'-nucleotidase SurE
MIVLLTNDDGPPSVKSPFISPFARALSEQDYLVNIVLPKTQKSWIGGGFLIEEKCHLEKLPDWTLIDGTPATCVNIALFHLFPETEVVIAGPNYGRNVSREARLSSGTMGAAFEAAVHGKRAIALSFAYFGNIPPESINIAVKASIPIIETLLENWPSDVDIFNVNIPLLEPIQNYRGVEFTKPFEKGYSSLFKKDEQGCFYFSPTFADFKSAQPGTDVWAVFNQKISITPMAISAKEFDLERFRQSIYFS